MLLSLLYYLYILMWEYDFRHFYFMNLVMYHLAFLLIITIFIKHKPVNKVEIFYLISILNIKKQLLKIGLSYHFEGNNELFKNLLKCYLLFTTYSLCLLWCTRANITINRITIYPNIQIPSILRKLYVIDLFLIQWHNNILLLNFNMN